MCPKTSWRTSWNGPSNDAEQAEPHEVTRTCVTGVTCPSNFALSLLSLLSLSFCPSFPSSEWRVTVYVNSEPLELCSSFAFRLQLGIKGNRWTDCKDSLISWKSSFEKFELTEFESLENFESWTSAWKRRVALCQAEWFTSTAWTSFAPAVNAMRLKKQKAPEPTSRTRGTGTVGTVGTSELVTPSFAVRARWIASQKASTRTWSEIISRWFCKLYSAFWVSMSRPLELLACKMQQPNSLATSAGSESLFPGKSFNSFIITSLTSEANKDLCCRQKLRMVSSFWPSFILFQLSSSKSNKRYRSFFKTEIASRLWKKFSKVSLQGLDRLLCRDLDAMRSCSRVTLISEYAVSISSSSMKCSVLYYPWQKLKMDSIAVCEDHLIPTHPNSKLLSREVPEASAWLDQYLWAMPCQGALMARNAYRAGCQPQPAKRPLWQEQTPEKHRASISLISLIMRASRLILANRICHFLCRKVMNLRAKRCGTIGKLFLKLLYEATASCCKSPYLRTWRATRAQAKARTVRCAKYGALGLACARDWHDVGFSLPTLQEELKRVKLKPLKRSKCIDQTWSSQGICNFENRGFSASLASTTSCPGFRDSKIEAHSEISIRISDCSCHKIWVSWQLTALQNPDFGACGSTQELNRNDCNVCPACLLYLNCLRSVLTAAAALRHSARTGRSSSPSTSHLILCKCQVFKEVSKKCLLRGMHYQMRHLQHLHVSTLNSI